MKITIISDTSDAFLVFFDRLATFPLILLMVVVIVGFAAVLVGFTTVGFTTGLILLDSTINSLINELNV